uniref:AUGMIN subunit 5-like n=1 Tax=Crassostrea virginica TaxID=6565 RepID=A0A8B8D0C3_CRAVI|nr:AUGMIN subunit 5-like [Crassostrea virginica]XP_022321591.1 AUGMIN subunit 5-like [Crassostrea virginica]XP_022321592.1 AUGMIN subunit 5-like [Crassostrea virginica]
MSTTHDQDIAEKLQTWAVQEMLFSPQGIHASSPMPKVENYREICRGPQKDIWKFIIENVHSAQTVKKMKGNLALKGVKTKSYKVKYKSDDKLDERRQNLLDKRAQLTGEVTAALKDISHLENDLGRLEQEILDTDKDCQLKTASVSNIRRKCALLKTYSTQCDLTAREFEEYSNQMTKKMTVITKRAKKSTENEEFYSRKKSSTDDDQGGVTAGLESKCSRDVRKACEYVGKFLLGALQGEFGTDKNVFHQKKQLLWKHMEETFSEHSVQQIYNSLVTNTQNAAFDMRDQTSKVDIRKDAEKLRFKYENSGELTDLATSPSLLQSVHQLLEENRMSQVRRFIETEKFLNSAWKGNQLLEEINAKIDAHLKKQFRNSKDLNLARNLVDLEVELAAKRAELQCLSQEATLLRENIAEALREKEILFVKYQKIQDFKEIANKKQELIQVIVRQNMNARSRLESQREEIFKYIKKTSESHHMEARLLKDDLHGYVNKEIDKFASLDLPQLMFCDSSDRALKVAVADMSINQTSCVTAREAMNQVLQRLNFKPFQAPELLMWNCIDLKRKIQKLVSLSTPLSVHGQDGESLKHITGLCERVKEQDRALLERTLPVLQQRLHKTGAALTDCGLVSERLQEWWEQPAQHTVPWVKVDNNTLQQWQNRWTVLSTKYRQLLLQKS